MTPGMLDRDLPGRLTDALQTPLSECQRLLAQIATDGPLTEQQSSLLNRAVHLSKELDRLVVLVVALAQPHMQITTPQKSHSVAALLQAVIDRVGPVAKQRTHQIQSDIAPDVLPIVGDRAGLLFALTALLDNAVKYSPNGASTQIRAIQHEQQVLIEIIDSGPGLPAKELEQIFTPYYRAPSTARSSAGYGLGLTLARLVIVQHGGTISASSIPGNGCSFRIMLPCLPITSVTHPSTPPLLAQLPSEEQPVAQEPAPVEVLVPAPTPEPPSETPPSTPSLHQEQAEQIHPHHTRWKRARSLVLRVLLVVLLVISGLVLSNAAGTLFSGSAPEQNTDENISNNGSANRPDNTDFITSGSQLFVSLIEQVRTLPTINFSRVMSGELDGQMPLSNIDIHERVIMAETYLRSGTLIATSELGGSNSIEVQMEFDLGTSAQVPRFTNTIIYTSTSERLITERITIGEQSWLRQNGNNWNELAEQTSVNEQIQIYMPRLILAQNLTSDSDATQTTLTWYDPTRDANMVLTVDSTSGIPKVLRQETRTTGVVLVVQYLTWNDPVEISPPLSEAS